MISPLSIVKASAGSGKTHYLSGHILTLLCLGEDSSKILASTFTRKAAGEMFERVVQRLIDATESDSGREKLLAELSLPRNSLSCEKLTEVLERIIQEQSRSRISTLDSFFVSIAQAFFTELYLPGSWKIADTWEMTDIEEAALERTISTLGKDVLQDILTLLNNRRHSSLIRSLLLGEMRSIHDTFNTSPAEAWGRISPTRTESAAPDSSQIRALMEMNHPVITDGEQVHKSTLTTARKFISWFEEKRWDDILASKLTDSICVSKSFSYYKKPVPPQICQGVEILYAHARACLLEELRERTIALAAIASEYTRQVIQISLEKGLLGFRELTRALSEGQNRIELQDIHYRLDSTISHILIDEFQDTAPLQWSILEPLASEILSKADQVHTFLTVGDVKQAIYAWRGGTSELFDVLTTQYPQLRDHERTLTTTYRSYPGIVTLVNSVFLDLPRNPALSEQQKATHQWSKNFHSHTAFKNGNYGKIRIKSLSVPEREHGRYSKQELRDAACGELFDDIVPILDSPAVKTIGILVRTNSQVNQLETFFSQQGYQVSGEGGEPLTHSRTIQLLISALTFSKHPQDLFCFQHLMDSPLRAYLNSQCGASDNTVPSEALLVSEALRKSYTNLGPEAFLRSIIHELVPFISSSDYDRCLYVLTLALGFERKGGSNPDELVRILSQSSIESASASRIRIMTFHKSKGLEFDAVFIPFTDDLFYSSRNISLLKKQENSLTPPSKIILSPKKQSIKHFPELEEMFSDATHNQTVEGLSMIYVALTRAVHSLFVYLPPVQPRDNTEEARAQTPGMASILRGAFGFHEELSPGTILYEHNGPFPDPEEKQESPMEDKEGSDTEILSGYEIPEFARLKNLHRTYPSDRDSSVTQRIRESLNRNALRGTDFGTKIHSILNTISWIDTSFDSLDLKISEDEYTYLSSAFSYENIRNIFNHHLFSDNLNDIQLERELPFSLIHTGEILSGRLDRLVILKKNNTPESACIIDFKTGKHADKKLLESQSNAYSLFVEKKYRIPKDHIVCRFAFLSNGEIIDFSCIR